MGRQRLGVLARLEQLLKPDILFVARRQCLRQTEKRIRPIATPTASGNAPKIVTMAVMRMGRNRFTLPETIAVRRSLP